MESLQLKEYIPVLMLFGVAVGAAAGMLIASVALGRWANKGRLRDRSRNKNINTPYECGMIAVGEGNTRLSVKFYLVAMLFILFDIEVVFMYPWAVVYKDYAGHEWPIDLWLDDLFPRHPFHRLHLRPEEKSVRLEKLINRESPIVWNPVSV